jgi:hypothetical protein
VELIAEFTKLDPEAIKGSCWTSFKPDGSVETDYLLSFQDWAIEKELVSSPLDLDQVWSSDFLDAAFEELDKE